jgi:Cu(I)/Ag(I) efflux system membrane fusion protein
MVTVRAPMAGTVVTRAVYEGQYVQTNDRLFEIGDFAAMWFVFDAHESDLPWLRVGQQVEVTTPSRPGEILAAPVAFIDPNLDEATRTVRVRVVLANPNRILLHNQTAFGRVRLEVPGVLSVPRSAVLQHGGRALVYVERAGHTYAARAVRLGRIGDDRAELLSGLAAGDRVVTEGGLILDSQAQLAHAGTAGEPDHGMTLAPTVHDAAPAEHDDAALALLTRVALTAADGAAALAADDLPGYRKVLPEMRDALRAYLAGFAGAADGPLARFADKLPDRDELKASRRDFEPYSTAVVDLAREEHVTHRESLHAYQCPMSPVLGTGRWLQRGEDLRNPFFGSAMLTCGEELR